MNAPAASPLVFQALTPHRAFEDIAGQIRAQVASGNLKPGDRLPPERELAALFQVSRNTLREALRALEIAGMIESRKGANGGAFVLPGNSGVVVRGMSDLYHLGAITPEHLTEARIWLSELVVRVVCERGSDEDLQALEANVARAAQADADNDFTLSTAEQIIATLDGISRQIGFATIGLAGVSLLIGAIGIANVMVMSVTERTREIGLRLAIGARRADVRRQFLIEAAVLSGAGGLLGVAIASVIGLVAWWAPVALALLAGLGYGLMYTLTARIEAAIALHFALNALVFLTLDLRVG